MGCFIASLMHYRIPGIVFRYASAVDIDIEGVIIEIFFPQEKLKLALIFPLFLLRRMVFSSIKKGTSLSSSPAIIFNSIYR